MKRATADKYIPLLQSRAAQVNNGPYALIIERIEVFGSYLTDKPEPGDLDIMVTTRKKYANEADQDALEKDRRRCAEQNGHTFPSFLERLFWPTEEVHRIIRGKNYRISLHTADERPFLTATYKTIYEL